MILKLANATAWNYPRLYLRLIAWWVVRRSAYYQLVDRCKSHQAEDPVAAAPPATQPQYSKKRILYLIHWYELGGAESYALYTIRTAQALGHTCFCIATVPSENTERQVFAQYCKETLDYVEGKGSHGFQQFIAQYIRENSIDVIHIHHSVLMYDALPVIRKEFPQLLIVDSTHIVEYHNGGFPRLSARYSDCIDRHNVTSKNLLRAQRAIYRQMFGVELEFKKFYLTYMSGLNKANITEVPILSRSRKVITFYGRFVLQKQPNIFIATVEHLIKNHPELDVEAHIYGEGEMQAALE
ncbi:MAG: glycosyltransferase, partial [Lysobacterales bacterium]